MTLVILSLCQLLFSLSQAIHLRAPAASKARVVGYDIVGERNIIHSGLDKRVTNSVTVNGSNAGTIYYANITVGTPPQPLTVQVDTGSSELILYSEKISGQPIGMYNANESSSYQYSSSDMNTSYANTIVTGDYATDIVTIGNATLPNMTFGVAYQQPQGTPDCSTWGIGTDTTLDVLQAGNRLTPYYMAQLGLISSPSYSLWLNDIDAPSGSLLFGGVDVNKYTGILSSLPMIPDGPNGTYYSSMVPLSGLYANDENGTIVNATNATIESFPVNVTLDSGTSQIFLPLRAVGKIYDLFNVTYDDLSGQATCACSLSASPASVGFAFGDTTIFVPMRSIVGLGDSFDPNACSFNIWTPKFANIDSESDESYLLGDPFLQNAYVVYDFSNYEISLAQSALNSTSPTRILEIMSGPDGIPNSRNATMSKPTFTALGTPGSTFVPSPSGVGTGKPTSSGPAAKGAVNLGLGAWALLVIVMCLTT